MTLTTEARLESVRADLEAGGVRCWVAEEASGFTAQLAVDLGAPCPTIFVCLLPGLSDPSILQFFVPTDHAVEAAALDGVARCLHAINASMPMTGFELGEATGAIVFRHLQSVPTDRLDTALVAWPLSMIYNAFCAFDSVIAQASRGVALPDVMTSVAEAVAASAGQST